MSEVRFMPPEASSHAANVDMLYYFLWSIAGFFAILIATLIVIFAVRYRHGPGNETGQEVRGMGAVVMEVAWIVIPLGITMIIFIWGARLYMEAYRVPGNASEILVVARQWMWKLQHENGRREINELHVPAGRNTMLLMTSQDVIHSFFVPAFRVKQDVLPGRYTTLWFCPTRPGTYHLFCAEYCGTMHSRMIGSIVVMQPEDYEAWLAGSVASVPPYAAGEALFKQLGCNTCHGTRAPTLARLYGTEVRMENGERVTVDENYLRESILDSTAKIVAGYQPIMPSFRGQLSEEQLMQLISYIKSLKDQREPGNAPKAPYGRGENLYRQPPAQPSESAQPAPPTQPAPPAQPVKPASRGADHGN